MAHAILATRCPTASQTVTDLHTTRPLHSQIRDWLREQIINGHYAEHDKLPSEKELMTRFAVSRITVRHALTALEQAGMVFKIAGKGCFVTRSKPTQELAQLQGFAEAMRSKGYQAHNRVLGIRTLPAPPAIAAALQLPPRAAVTEIRRVRYLDRLAVSVDVTYVAANLGQRLAREDLAGRDIFSILENDYGLILGHADLAIDAVQADATLAAHLDVATGAPLLYLERLTCAQDGTPLELDYIHYRGDRFRYRLRIERSRR